jgi:hypothetical protein
MKKIVLLIALVGFFITTIQAQVKEKSKRGEQSVVKTTPAPTPASDPAVVSVYRLTSARVNIRTGSDNKEFPSKVFVMLTLRNTNYCLYEQPGDNMRNEMRINSNTEFGLQKHNDGTPERLTLEALQNQGIVLLIRYVPNFFADAWKIEGVSVSLEFKDQNGNLHPTLGNKTILFTNANGFLNDTYRWMNCYTDGGFSPLTSSIK